MDLRNRATITNIGGGLAPALFEKGLERVLDNIADPATSAVKQRKVKIEFAFKPDEERRGVEVEIKMETTLAQIGSKKAIVYLSKDNDDALCMSTSDPRQMELAEQLTSIQEIKKVGNQ